MRITRAAKVAAFPLTALILVALVACQGPAGPAGASGAKGDTGASGSDGAQGPAGIDAPRNMAPTLKDGEPIGTRYLALNARNADGTEITTDAINVFKKYETIEVSKYFEDPEGVVDLIYSLADLSDDDKTIVTVSLAATAAVDTVGSEDGDIDDDDETPAHQAAVTGKAYLNISGKGPGSVTLMLTVKDGLPEGVTTQSIQVHVREANAPPVIDTAVLTAAVYGNLSRLGTMRIPTNDDTVIMIPAGAFTDANNDALTITAEIGGTAGTDAIVTGSVPYNAARLGVAVDGNSLVLTPKRGGDNANIPVIVKATDQYGASVMTGNDAGTTPPTGTILVEVNTPPMHTTYADVTSPVAGLTVPAGVSNGDPIKLAHITNKTYSVAGEAAANEFITLATFFVDPDTEDSIGGDEHICSFSTSPADQEFAEVAFDEPVAVITVEPAAPGMFDLSVTCTDHVGETVTDSVTVTILQ